VHTAKHVNNDYKYKRNRQQYNMIYVSQNTHTYTHSKS
jgi:hypothetical protein